MPFVLWVNFIAGGFYIIAGIRLGLQRSDVVWWAGGIPLASLLVYGAFAVHLLTGGVYEVRTVWAMLSRTGFWAGMTGVSWWLVKPSRDR